MKRIDHFAIGTLICSLLFITSASVVKAQMMQHDMQDSEDRPAMMQYHQGKYGCMPQSQMSGRMGMGGMHGSMQGMGNMGCACMNNMMGGMSRMMGGFPVFRDKKEFLTFLDNTKELRRELHNTMFDYMENMRDPDANAEQTRKVEDKIYELKKKIMRKALE